MQQHNREELSNSAIASVLGTDQVSARARLFADNKSQLLQSLSVADEQEAARLRQREKDRDGVDGDTDIAILKRRSGAYHSSRGRQDETPAEQEA